MSATMVEATPEPLTTAGQPVTTTTQVQSSPQAPTTEAEEEALPVIITAESPTKPVATATDLLHPPEATTLVAHPNSATEPPTASAEEVAPQTTVPTTPVSTMSEIQTQPNPPLAESPSLAAPVEKQPAETPMEPVADEPENALTKKFTIAEWTALNEFRVNLFCLSES